MLLMVLMGLACYGCASVAGNRNQGSPLGVYSLTVTASSGTLQHSSRLRSQCGHKPHGEPDEEDASLVGKIAAYSSGSDQFSNDSLTLCRN
jgi:hypothetical protein